jgi:hypothetical protein
MIEKAVLRIPKHKRNRYREEWLAHLDEIPGNLGRLTHAFQCYFVASRGVAKAVSKPRKRRVGIAQRPNRKAGLLTIELFHIRVKFAGTLPGRILAVAFTILKQTRTVRRIEIWFGVWLGVSSLVMALTGHFLGK